MYCTDDLSMRIFETLRFSFFSSEVPVLVYYSHLTAIVVSLVLSFFVVHNNRESLAAWVLGITSFIFSAWSVADILLWTQIDSRVIMFLWSFWFFFFISIFVLSFYFLYVFIKKKDAPFGWKIFFLAIISPVLLLSFTHYNLSGFDVYNCTAIENPFMINVTYILAGIFFISVCIFGIREYFRETEPASKRQIVFSTIGIILFLLCFSIATYIASIANIFNAEPDTFAIEQYGYFGMTIFIAFLTYTIVRYKAFNIKLIAAQALVFALVILIGSQFFFIRNNTNKILNGVTLALSLGFGYLLVKSVKREIEAKEKVEKLAGELEQANIQQESLIRFISHEMKGYLTTSAGVFASIVEGDFNPISDTLKSSAEMALTKVREGVRSVVEILSNANAKKGTLAYKMEPFDFGKVVLESITKLSHDAQEKGLVLETAVKDDGTYRVMGDTAQLSEHVVRNLIDNSIKYTPAGSVHVELSKSGSKVLLAIRDTGVGITAEDKARLFTEGGRGKDSLKVNVHSTGYGLAIAKKIVDAHSGRIWAESEGAGKGSQFYVELPEAK